MDPLAHTLAGASLAQSGLKRLTPLATATLLAGANLPDVDIVANAWGGDASLYFRRGWTHGALSMLVLPIVLTAIMLVADRLIRLRRPDATPARAGPLLLLSVIGVWSHPALDWLNTYGVRLLMPFSGTWFYGDAVFIVDPWLWLLLAAAVVVATTAHAPGVVGWAVIGSVTTAVIMMVDEVPAVARVLWGGGVAAIIAARIGAGNRVRAQQLARMCLLASAVYIALMILGSRIASSYAAPWLDREGSGYRQIMAGPLPVDPIVREIIVVREDRYSFFKVNVLTGSLQPYGPDVPTNGPTAITEAALHAPQVRGLRQWTRFPSYEVEQTPSGYRVHIRDVRYSRFGARARGIGEAMVDLDADLRPR